MCVSLNQIGSVAEALRDTGGVEVHAGNWPGARSVFGDSLSIHRQLAHDEEGNFVFARQVALDLYAVGQCSLLMRDMEAAREAFAEMRDILVKYLDADPDSHQASQDLALAMNSLAQVAREDTQGERSGRGRWFRRR